MKKVLIFFITIIVFFSCEENEYEYNNVTGIKRENHVFNHTQRINKSKAALENKVKLDIFSRNMAFALREEAVLTKLSSKLLLANNKEKIVDLKTWLNSNIMGKTIDERMAESGYVENINNEQRRVKTGDFISLLASIGSKADIYFPVDIHRSNWFENRHNLMVAYVDPSDEWAPVVAYTLSGERKELDSHNPPIDPVLVISLCEHHGIHTGSNNSVDAMQQQEDDDETGGGGSGDGSGGGSFEPEFPPRQSGNYDFIYKIRQTNCQEPWGKGDPEICFDVLNANGDPIFYYYGDDYPEDEDDLVQVYANGMLTCFDCTYGGFLDLEIFHDYDWYFGDQVGLPDYGKFHTWGNSNSDKSYDIHWFEDDGILDDSYWDYSDDDDMGTVTVNRTDSNKKLYDTGYLQFKIRWTHQGAVTPLFN